MVQKSNKKPLVSVVIPTFNYGHYVCDAVDSVLSQTYENVEILVVDDGSTDDTQERLKKYDGRIVNILQKNAGLSAARNTGIRKAKGEFIAILDSDDIWEKEKLAEQMNVFASDEAGRIGVVSCAGECINEQGGVIETTGYTDLNDEYKFFETLVTKNIISGGSCAVVRKKCFDEVGLFDETLRSSEDWDMWLRIQRVVQIRVVSKPLVKIRVGSNNMSSEKYAARMLENEMKVLDKLSRENPKVDKRLINKGKSYRLFCAAWAYWQGKEHTTALKHIVQSFLKYPSDFMNKKQGGLFIKIVAVNILRFSIPVNRITKPFFAFLYNVHVFIREFLIVFIKVIYYEPLFRSQCKDVGSGLWMEQLPYLAGSGEIVIGNNVRISGKPTISFNTKIYESPKLLIADNTFIGHDTRFAVAQSVRIGKNCYIAGGVTISDNDGHPADAHQRRKNLPPSKECVKAVEIADDVWIGREAVILKGVKIGERAIIGTRAVVTKDVPPDTIVGGNPAKVIGQMENN